MVSDELPELSPTEKEELQSYKYLLGDFGIAIAAAIIRGARTEESIMMLSGVPPACVKGRLPVLINLKLISKVGINEYAPTTKGLAFLKCVKGCVY